MNKLNEALKKAERIVFLTGAGVSVPSGIPDYRSKNGLYAGMSSPEYMLSHTCLVREPEKFYQFVTENMYYPDAEPNAIHTKMAEIEAKKMSRLLRKILMDFMKKRVRKSSEFPWQSISLLLSKLRNDCYRKGLFEIGYSYGLWWGYSARCGALRRSNFRKCDRSITYCY